MQKVFYLLRQWRVFDLVWLEATAFGRETFLYVTTNRREQKRLPRVFALEMWFWKNRLVRINLKYYGSETSRSINQFMAAIETHFNLSQTNRISAHRYQCGNVIVSVAEDGKRTISLRDAVGEKILDRRVEEIVRP